MSFILHSGRHNRKNTPVFFRVPAETLPGGALCIKLQGGQSVPASYRIIDDEAEICFVAPFLPAGESLAFTLESFDSTPEMTSEKTENGVEIFMRGGKFTEYCTRTGLAKPYLGPFREAYGGQMTRLDFETREHPHHRSLWISQEVNGIDFWNEPAGVHGIVRNQSIDDIVCGGAYTAFTANNLWTSHGGEAVMNESTRYTLYNTTRAAAVLDVDITYIAAYGDIELNATKEAGPLAIRMAPALSVDKGGTGMIVSGTGGIDEKECWMRRAPWLDYCGNLDGRACGVAILDHPGNFGFPTHWHVRDGGLMAGNNFLRLGAMYLKQGESTGWKYRVVIHNGDTKSADIQGRFEDYAFPPAVVRSTKSEQNLFA